MGVRRWWLVTAALLAAGVLLRLQQYLLGRSLWIDEARLALSIVSPHEPQLVGHLLYDQVSPPAFLAVSRLFVLALGPSELSLRLLSLLAGISALIATAFLARRVAGEVAAALAVLMLTLSPAAIYYSQEFKHYSCDMLVGVLLPFLALTTMQRGSSLLEKCLFAAVCVLSVWFSASGVLVVAGTLGALMTVGASNRRWRMVIMAMVAGIVTAFSFAVAYRVSYQFASNGELMRGFWEGTYLKIWPLGGVIDSFGLVIAAGMGMLSGPRPILGFFVSGSYAQETIFALLTLGMLAAAVWGALDLVRRGASQQVIVVCGPAAGFVLASLIQAYPASTRLLLFLAGPWAILAAAGLVAVSERTFRAAGKYVPFGLVAITSLAGAPSDGKWRMADTQWSGAREMVDASVMPNVPLYLYSRAIPQFIYYAFEWKSPQQVRQASLYRVSDYGGVAFENAAEFHEGIGVPDLAQLESKGLLAGVSTGMQFSPSSGWSRNWPADSWAESEATRIDRRGAERVMLLFLHQIDGAASILRRTLLEKGWSCIETMRNYDELLLSCRRVGGVGDRD